MRADTAADKHLSIRDRRYADRRFNGNVFETRMDPESQALKYPTRAMPITARRNPYVTVDYEGPENIADNTVGQAVINRNSSMYRLHDLGNIPLETYYLGLGLKPESKNLAYNQQFVNDMTEAIAAAYATQYTELPFLRQRIRTSIPLMDVEGTPGRAGFTVWYAQFMQCCMAVFAKFNSVMAMIDMMVEMGYNGEAPVITEITNLMKKANVYSLMQQLGVTIRQEYVDLDWFKTINILNAVPSRVANDVNHPLLTISAVPYMPSVQVKDESGQTVLFDTDTDPAFSNIRITLNGYSETFSGITDLVQAILMQLDPFNIIMRARQLYTGRDTTVSPALYVNIFMQRVHALLRAAARFKGVTTDFDTFLMLLQSSTNLNKWMINTPFVMPSRPREQYSPVLMGVVDDIFKAYGTSGNLVYDENTRRWAVATGWSEETGIVEYDYYEGGFSISTSVREIPHDPNGYEDVRYMFPVIFHRHEYTSGGTPVTVYQRFGSRDGSVFTIETEKLNASAIAADPTMAGYNVISDPNLVVERPVVVLSNLTTDKVRMWAIIKVLAKIFGPCRVQFGSFNYSNMDPDLNFYVGRQFTKYAESGINYLSGSAPLRMVDHGYGPTVGFKFQG